jgi:hypothetical protein
MTTKPADLAVCVAEGRAMTTFATRTWGAALGAALGLFRTSAVGPPDDATALPFRGRGSWSDG